MIVADRSELLLFLINRWRTLISLGAIERVYSASTKFCADNNLPEPQKPSELTCKPEAQLEIIKKTIAKILPEAKFVDYSYEPPVPLNTDDFIELYVADHTQCLEKLLDVMETKSVGV